MTQRMTGFRPSLRALAFARNSNIGNSLNRPRKLNRRRSLAVKLVMHVFAFMPDEIPDNFVLNACVIKFVLHVVPEAVKRKFCAVRTQFLIDNLPHTTANLAPKGIVPSFIKIRKETVLLCISCFLNMIQKTEIDQVGVDRDQST